MLPGSPFVFGWILWYGFSPGGAWELIHVFVLTVQSVYSAKTHQIDTSLLQ